MEVQVERPMVITLAQAREVLRIIDKGLCAGLGSGKPGRVCVEAAVCLAFGEPHSDQPKCVDHMLRDLKIRLNDNEAWERRTQGKTANQCRAEGLRRLGLAQLGSRHALDRKTFASGMVLLAAKRIRVLNKRKKTENGEKVTEILSSCKTIEALIGAMPVLFNYRHATGTEGLADLYYAISQFSLKAYESARAYATDAMLRGVKTASQLAVLCEQIVQILIKMNVPGVKWLSLTEES